MQLKLYIQQTLTYDLNNNRIYYDGTSPYTLRSIQHNNTPFPAGRSFPNNPDWYEITEHVSDLHKLKLTWASNKDSNGLTTPGASQMQKGASGTLSFEGEAYRLLKQWLIDDISASLNSVDVRIEHVGCDSYYGYTIKSSDLRWCRHHQHTSPGIQPPHTGTAGRADTTAW